MTALDGKRKKRRGAPVRRRVTRRERQLEIAINNISPGVALFNAAGRLVLCNKRYIDMYNLSPDVVKPGCPLKELLRHRYQVAQLVTDPDEVGCALLDSIANGETVTRLIEARDGRVARAVSRPLPGGGWVATHEDITERHKAELAVAQAEAAAEAAHRRLLDAFDVCA